MTGRRTIVAVAFALSATGILANTLILPVLPDMARDLGISAGAAGLVVSAASLPGIVVAPLIGLLADRYGRRSAIIPCLVVFGIAGLAGMAAPSFRVLLVLRLVQGVGAAGLVNLAVVVLGDAFSGARRARMIGLNAVVLTTGLAVFPTIGGALADLFGGWRVSFAPYGLSLLVAVAAARALPRTPRGARTMREQARAAGPFLRDPRVIVMAAAGFVTFILVFGVSVTLPIHLDEQFRAGALVRGLMLALPAAGAGGVALAMGRLATRWTTWDLVPVGLGLIAAAYVGVAVAPALGLITLPAMAYGAGEGLTVVPLQNFAAAIAPDEHRGIIVAAWVSAARAGQVAGPALAAVAIDAFGTRGAFFAGTCFAVTVSAAAFAARPRMKARGTAVAAT